MTTGWPRPPLSAPFPEMSLQRNACEENPGAARARHRDARCRPRGRAASGGVDRDLRCAEPRRRSRERLFAGSPCAAHRERGGLILDRVDRRGRSSARDRRALCARSCCARPRSCQGRRGRSSHGDGGALGIRGGSLMSWCGGGGLRAAECFARSLCHTPLCASRQGERGHRSAASPRKRMGGAKRGGNPLPRRAGAGRRNRRFRQRRRPHGLVPDLGEEPSGTDRCLHGGVGCS